ncbi:MAG TPA: 4Fe-4S dicluster domain-containing protein [Candidatus Acidoferrales bacterium]|nr:4Fe-4S dicluster domain-containing protein [Candidatus Acidoferrales bacterium]
MVLKPILKVLKQIASKPYTMEYPENKPALTDNYRGIEKLDMKTCISCSACERICPNSTITMVDVDTEKGTKVMPEINIERCLFCGLCEEVCPPKCLVLTKDYSFEKYDRREFVKRPEELD